MIAGCAHPTTQWPNATQQEIDAEAALQTNNIYNQDFTSLYDTPPTERQMQKRLSKIAKKIGPAAIELCKIIRKQGMLQRCIFDIELGGKKVGFNAYADGDKIVIGGKLLRFIDNDTQLAFILAHEFAHNIMGHVEDTKNNMAGGALIGILIDAAIMSAGGGNPTAGGGFSALGSEIGAISYSVSYEHEADYVGLYIMKRAGFNIDNAPQVWRKIAALSPENIYTNLTHPTSPERFVVMRKTIAEIQQKQQSGQPLLPNIKTQNQ